MKNLFKFLFASCLLVGTLVSCDEIIDDEPEVTPIQLATPQPQIIESEDATLNLFWPEVENAAYYMVRLNDGEAVQNESTSVSFTQLVPGTYTVAVQAIAGEGSNFIDSEWGEVSTTLSFENAFTLEITDLTSTSCTVTCTPINLESTYIFNTLPGSLYRAYPSDEEFLNFYIEDVKTQCKAAGISFQKGLEVLTSTGVDVWKAKGFSPDTEYVAFAFGITLQGEVTTPLKVVSFTTLP